MVIEGSNPFWLIISIFISFSVVVYCGSTIFDSTKVNTNVSLSGGNPLLNNIRGDLLIWNWLRCWIATPVSSRMGVVSKDHFFYLNKKGSNWDPLIVWPDGQPNTFEPRILPSEVLFQPCKPTGINTFWFRSPLNSDSCLHKLLYKVSRRTNGNVRITPRTGSRAY